MSDAVKVTRNRKRNKTHRKKNLTDSSLDDAESSRVFNQVNEDLRLHHAHVYA